MICKFKKFLNICNGKFSTCFQRFLFPPGRVFKQVFCCLFAGVVIGVIVVPCAVKMSSAHWSQERSKFINGCSVLVKGIQKNAVGVLRSQERRIIQHSQFGGERRAKLISSTIKFLDASILNRLVYSETITEPKHQTTTEEGGKLIRNKCIKDIFGKVYHWLPLWLACSYVLYWFIKF